VLQWRRFKQQDPYGDLHVGFCGRTPFAAIEVEGEREFQLHFSLPHRGWRNWHDRDGVICDHRPEYTKLETAKKAAERRVEKWLASSKLIQRRTR